MKFLLVLMFILVLYFVKKYSTKKYGYISNVNFIVTLIWVVFAVISIFNPLDLRQPDTLVYYYSLVFLISYNVFCLTRNIPFKSYNVSEYDNAKLKIINRRIVLVEMLALLVYSPLLLLSISAFLAGRGDEVRMSIYFGGEATFFTRNIPNAILTTIMIISLYLYFRNNSKIHLVNSLLLVGLLSIASAGRGEMFCFISLYLFLVLLHRRYGLKVSRIPLYLAIAAISVMTVSVRGGDIYRSMVTYFSGSFSFLDYILDHPVDYGLDEYHYGIITLSPITEPLIYILKALHLTAEKIPSYWLNLYVQTFVDIGGGHEAMFNNNTTILLPFILDGGIVGIIFGGIFTAFLTMKSYNYFIKGNAIGGVFFLYVMNSMFMSTISYQGFMSVTPFVALLIIYICFSPIYKAKSK